jgi:hypothetical protein
MRFLHSLRGGKAFNWWGGFGVCDVVEKPGDDESHYETQPFHYSALPQTFLLLFQAASKFGPGLPGKLK